MCLVYEKSEGKRCHCASISPLPLQSLHSETRDITSLGLIGGVRSWYQRSPSLPHGEPKTSYSVYSISSFLSAEDSLSLLSLLSAPYNSKSLELSLVRVRGRMRGGETFAFPEGC